MLGNYDAVGYDSGLQWFVAVETSTCELTAFYVTDPTNPLLTTPLTLSVLTDYYQAGSGTTTTFTDIRALEFGIFDSDLNVDAMYAMVTVDDQYDALLYVPDLTNLGAGMALSNGGAWICPMIRQTDGFVSTHIVSLAYGNRGLDGHESRGQCQRYRHALRSG